MAAQSNRYSHFRHVLPAHELRANSGQLTFLPLWMGNKQSLCYHQSQHRIAQELQALIISRARRLFVPALNRLVGHCPFRSSPLVRTGTMR
jgi:hypothetical protein